MAHWFFFLVFFWCVVLLSGVKRAARRQLRHDRYFSELAPQHLVSFTSRGPSFVKSCYHFGSAWTGASSAAPRRTNARSAEASRLLVRSSVRCLPSNWCCSYTLTTAKGGVWTTYVKTPQACVQCVQSHNTLHERNTLMYRKYKYQSPAHNLRKAARHTQAVISAC